MNYLKLGYLFLFLIGLTFVYSCQKESAIQDVIVNDDEITSSTTLQQKAIQIVERRKNSNEDINLRDGDVYTIEEAEALLDHAMNYEYCRPDAHYTSVKYFADTSSRTFSISDTIDESEINSLLDEITCFGSGNYYNIPDTPKEPYLFDMEFIEDINNDLKLQMVMLVGIGNQSLSSLGYPYSSGDYWHFAFNKGLCLTSPPSSNEDALDQWRRDLNYNETIYISHKNTTKYVKYSRSFCMIDEPYPKSDGIEIPYNPMTTNIDIFLLQDDIINTNDPTPTGDGYLDYWCYNGTYGQTNCVTPTEMNYHYGAMLDGFEDLLDQGERFIRFEQGYDFLTGGGPQPHISIAITGKVVTLQEAEPAVALPVQGVACP